jgi:hypothetical protein
MNDLKDIKAFYVRVNDDGKTVAAMDVLATGIGEIIGGSQREERLEALDMRAWPSAASTRSTTPGTAICAATARRRTPASANLRDAITFPRTPATRSIDASSLAIASVFGARWALDAYGVVTAPRGFRFVRSATDSPNSNTSLNPHSPDKRRF